MLKIFKKVFAFALVLAMLMSALPTVSFAAQEVKTNKVMLVSFNDGVFSADAKSQKISNLDYNQWVQDEEACTSGSKALAVKLNGARFSVKIPDIGLAQAGVKKANIKYRAKTVKGAASNPDVTGTSECVRIPTYVRTSDNIFIKNDANYPYIFADGWKVYSVEIPDTSAFWKNGDYGELYLDATKKSTDHMLYIDSVWLEYDSVTETQRNKPWTRMLYDFKELDELGTYTWEKGWYSLPMVARGDISGSYGGYYTNRAAPGSTYSLVASYNSYGMFFYDNSSYNPRTNLDWTEYKYVVFRMKADGTGDKNFILSFAPQTTEAGGDLTRNTITSIGNVVDVPVTINQQWNDYKIPVSDLSSAYLNSYTKKTIGGFRFHHVDHTKSEDTSPRPASVYIDSIYLEKEGTDNLAAPTSSVTNGSDALVYLDGKNQVTFTFEEDLIKSDYNDAVEVKLGSTVLTDGYMVTASGKNLIVKFADALKPASQYTITLKGNAKIRTTSKHLKADFVLGFNTLAAKLDCTNLTISKSEGDTVVLAKATFSNTFTTSKNDVSVMLASYTGDGALKELITVPAKDINLAPVQVSNVEAKTNITQGYTYKAFVWENTTGSLRPLVKSAYLDK